MLKPEWRSIALAGAIACGAWIATGAGDASAQQPRQPAPAAPQAPAQPQQGQQPPAERVKVVELTQAVLERWMVLFAELNSKLATLPNATEQQVEAVVAEACKKAQLTDVEQCRALDAYMGALLSGGDEQAKRFVDPVQRVREDLRGSQADPKLGAKEKAEAKAELEGILAQLPTQIPPAHLQLVNRNATRIFDLLAKYTPADQQSTPSQGGAQPPAQGGQPPRR